METTARKLTKILRITFYLGAAALAAGALIHNPAHLVTAAMLAWIGSQIRVEWNPRTRREEWK